MVLSRLNPIHSLPCYSLNIQFSIFFTFTPSSFELLISFRLSHPLSMRVCLPAFVLHILPIKSSLVSARSIINDAPHYLIFFSPVASSNSFTNIHLINQFSNTLSLYSVLSVREDILQPYQRTGKIIVL